MVATTFRGVRWSRKYTNRQTGRIKAVFKWAVAGELVPPSVYHGLMAVADLPKGRSEARETAPVRPVPEEFVRAVRPLVSSHIRTMTDLQLLTGMRPGEVCVMRTCDIDRSRRVWLYRPAKHKTQHHGNAGVKGIVGWPRVNEMGEHAMVQKVKFRLENRTLLVFKTCVNLRREFRSWKYKTDKEGRPVSGDAFADGNNHLLDGLKGFIATNPVHNPMPICTFSRRGDVRYDDDDEDDGLDPIQRYRALQRINNRRFGP